MAHVVHASTIRRLPSRRLPLVLAGSLVAALSLLTIPANAATTVTPSESGTVPVVRDDAVTVSVDRSALSYYRSSSTGTYAPVSPAAVFLTNATSGLGQGCRGDIAGADRSPRTTVTVQDPDGNSVLNVTSPVRDMNTSGFLTSPPQKPLSPQPAAANSNYRGDFPDSSSNNPFHGMSAQLSLAGKPAGLYTVTTKNSHTVKQGLTGACSVGVPSGSGTSTTIAAGPEVATKTFEYRPWKHNFKDIQHQGKVALNTTPAEFTFSIGSKTTPVYPGGANTLSFYSLPSGTGFALPSDPTDCVEDAESCLPVSANRCNPAAGCTPRVAIINLPPTSGKQLVGVFDLETKAFIAYATIDGTSRVLLSLGTALDPIYDSVVHQLSDNASSSHIDFAKLLATEVQVNGGGGSETTLSLLNGLQINPSDGKAGVQIKSDATVQAGIILHIYLNLRLSGAACLTKSASSTTEPDRFTPTESHGYTVTKSDLLPEVPPAGALGAIVGGPLYHITGKFNSDGTLANTAAAVIGLDTAVDEPNGYPVWIEPFISSPTHAGTPRTMDFLGTGTWSASQAPVAGAGCLITDFVLGTGVALFNNPLPVGLGTVFDPAAQRNAAAEQLTDKVNEALADATEEVTSNPTVASLLAQLTAALPLS